MKTKKTPIVLVLGILLVALAAADVFLYTQGKQAVKHVEIQEIEPAKESEGEEYTVEEYMEAFSITSDSEAITEYVSGVVDEEE